MGKHGDIWHQIYQLSDDHEGVIMLRKVKAHRTAAHLAGGIIGWEAYAGNAMADELAGMAASSCQLGLDTEELVKRQDRKARQIQERLLAAALLAIAAGRPDSNGSGSPDG